MAFCRICFGVFVIFNWQPASSVKNNAYLLQDHKSYSISLSVTNQNGVKPGINDSQIFLVQAPKYHRVMIVIQQLHLWPELEPDLRSYLKFVDSDGSESEKIYGNIDPNETDLTPQYLTGPRSFASTENTASLLFINMRPDYQAASKNERRVYAKVVFTAFRDTCSYRSLPVPGDNVTEIESSSSSKVLYRSCTTSSASGKNCIPAELFCDGSYNCGETEPGTFGLDETYINCDETTRASRTYSVSKTSSEDDTVKIRGKSSGDMSKTLLVDQEYDEHLTELFKSVIIGFLGLCTTCILIAFVVTMFCLRPNRSH